MLQITSAEALWFLPFVAPICFYVAWTDMKMMKITNQAVVALALVFVVIGPFAFSLETYIWRYLHLIVALLLGIVLNAGGVMGAGDAKFAAAAAPFVALGDLSRLAIIFAAVLLAAWVTHRIAKHSPLRNLVPHWESWTKTKEFPMGFALGGTLAAYLLIGAFA
ncbi:prepilin peptidase [Cognatishimia maritima]|uniref:Prepilin peptidase CpaA n=1 Tax=Cognatishimia maritima TaxID=870908 RepID=A0A1M5KX97_9RHOB|nr:prepilin peptidase [Cognatishimia maritima]SHG56783.1 prepilin peptidase CpaA [Cognatishimia maritima]